MLETSTKYAIQAIRFLTNIPHDDYVKVSEIAKATKLPGPYLSKVFKVLAKQKLIDARRGKAGGVRVSPGKSISYLQIARVLEDPVATATCLISRRVCSQKNACVAHSEWSKLKSEITGFLEKQILSKK